MGFGEQGQEKVQRTRDLFIREQPYSSTLWGGGGSTPHPIFALQ